MKELIRKLYHNEIISGLLHTLVHELQRELKDCETVLDLGCGPSSPIQHCKNVKHSVGVEIFGPYLEESKSKGIHSEYLQKKISELNFPEDSFDAVIMIEVLEHLPKETGEDILKKAERWARKKIIISSPNGFIAQKAVDGNQFQKHLSGWDYREMKSRDFKVRGLAGPKVLRQEVQNDTMGDNLLTSIKYRPQPLWFLIAGFSQLFTYYLPEYSFELFSVKNKEKQNV